MYYFSEVQKIKAIRQKLIEVAQDEFDNWRAEERGVGKACRARGSP